MYDVLVQAVSCQVHDNSEPSGFDGFAYCLTYFRNLNTHSYDLNPCFQRFLNNLYQFVFFRTVRIRHVSNPPVHVYPLIYLHKVSKLYDRGVIEFRSVMRGDIVNPYVDGEGRLPSKLENTLFNEFRELEDFHTRFNPFQDFFFYFRTYFPCFFVFLKGLGIHRI